MFHRTFTAEDKLLNLVSILGFTGTQNGMRLEQRNALRRLLRQLQPNEFHHGDCIGADEQAHRIVRKVAPNCRIVIHPPSNPSKRAWCEGDVILPEKDYLVRNRDIVNVSTEMVATPYERIEQLRSGTWSTIRYARKNNRKLHLLLPEGEFE